MSVISGASEWDFEAYENADFEMDTELGFDGFIDDTTDTGEFKDFEMINTFKPLSTSEFKLPYVQRYIEPGFCPKGSDTFKVLEGDDYNHVCDSGIVFSAGAEVWIDFAGKGKYKIGRSTCNRSDRFEIDSKDAIKRADIYAEEVKGKGTGLSFSNFVHSVVLLMFAKRGNAIIEPLEGNDLTFLADDDQYFKPAGRVTPGGEDALRIEITSHSFMNRITNAHWVIDKNLVYKLLIGCDDYIKYSRCEETLDTSFLRYSESFIGESPYTKVMDLLHDDIRYCTQAQRSGLVKMLLNFYANYEYEMTEPVDEDPIKLITDIINSGSKVQHDKSSKMPVPFRALSLPDVDTGFDKGSYEVKCLLFDDVRFAKEAYENNRSTFHTLELDHNIIDQVIEINDYVPPKERVLDYIEDYTRERLLKYKTVQSIRINNDLYARINGSHGYYFSETHQIGISWNRKHRSAFTYSCIFYSFMNPGKVEDVGSWSKLGKTFRSPTFTVSKQDISFAQCLYARVQTMYMSVLNSMGSDKSFFDLESKLVRLMALCNGSSYQTSTLLDNSRFVTTGHLAGNDRKLLSTRGVKIDKPLRSCDFLAACLIKRYVTEGTVFIETPLLRLPQQLLCLEKDIGLMLNWTNRECDHDTKCVNKLLLHARSEIENREVIIKWYEVQHEFMTKMRNVGCNQKDFTELMNKAPEFPAFCVPFFLSVSEMMKEELQVASATQSNTGFTIESMLSDHGSIKISGNEVSGRKVADELVRLVNEVKPHGPYTLLNHCLKDKREFTYLLRSKNGRGRREFATQFIEERVTQNFSECLATSVSLALPDDQFKEPEKYCEMVNNFTKIMNSKSTSEGTSEDRSGHCHNNQNEGISLALACIARCTNSNAMVFNSALYRRQTFRWVIMPPLYSGINHEGLEFKMYSVSQAGKVYKVPAVKVYYNKQQGMGATTVGVINTVQASALMKAAQIITKGIKDSYVITTQDDAGRAVSYMPGIETAELSKIIFDKPMGLLKYSSQLPNLKKHVKVKDIGAIEVNNICMTSSGMVSQEAIHASLIIQPLTGETPIDDLSSICSNARSTIFWGDGPTISMSALNFSIKMFQNKWLASNQQIEILRELRVIPNTIEELISGFYPRTDKALANILSLEKANEIGVTENWGKIIKNTRSLFTTFRRVSRLKQLENEREPVFTGMKTLDRKLTSLYDARNLQGRLKMVNARPMSIKVKKSKMKFMMDTLDGIMFNYFDPEVLKEVKAATMPPDAFTVIKPMDINDKMPCKMGISRDIVRPNLKQVKCMKYLNALYRCSPNDEEQELYSLCDEKFEDEVNRINKTSWTEGISIPCPGGLPVVRILGSTRYTKPHCFNFGFKLKDSGQPRVRKNFTYQGTEVENLKPIMWGGYTINYSNGLKAFAIGMIGDRWYAFYQKRKSNIRAIDVTKEFESGAVMKTYERMSDNVDVLFKSDFSPFEGNYNRKVAGLSGDPQSVLNYGRFVGTNCEGFTIFSEVYESKNSVLPYFIKDILPSYPQFHPNVKTIKAKMLTMIGSNCVGRIKLERDPCLENIKVDLTGKEPLIMDELIMGDLV
jgi:hypothetical protein